MTASTSAVILPSNATIGPWGDDAWRMAGAIQYVSDGPDYLLVNGPDFEGDADKRPSSFNSLTVRTTPVDAAADIAVMALAVLQVEEWLLLQPWWNGTESRDQVRYVLDNVLEQYRDRFKLAVVELDDRGIGHGVKEELEKLGLRVETFARSTQPA